MKILLSHLSQSQPLFSSQPLQWRNHPASTLSPHVVRLLRLPISAPRCVAAPSPADSAALNGWDDLRLRADPGHSGESNLIRNYLNSLGFDNKKYVIVYVLGFVCALAISRVRAPSIVVVPAAAIVFAVGFSFGFLNGGRGVNSSGGKRKSKGEDLKVSGDKLRNLVKLYDDFDVRVGKLKDHISEAVQNQRVGVDDLKSYVDSVELMGLCVKKARNVVDECLDLDSLENHEADRNLNKKPNRKRKESGESGFNWFQHVFRVFQDNATGAKSSKKKEGAKTELKHVKNLSRDDLQDEERLMNSKYASDARRPSRKDSENAHFYRRLDVNGKTRSDYEGQKINGVARNGNFSSMEVNNSRELSQSRINERFIDSSGREINFQSNRIRFADDQQVTLKMSEYDEIGQGISHDALDDDVVFRSHSRNGKMHGDIGGAIESSLYGLEGAYESHNNGYGDKTGAEGNLLENDDRSIQETEFASSSSVLSDDILFDKCLTEAYSILKQAKDCLRVRDAKMPVEQMLHESAKLLSRALSLKPMSLLATGLLGNTYLLQGELKLKFSQELRFLISGGDDSNIDRLSRIPFSKDEPLPTRDKLVSRLMDVCEECEELLVEAGRKYKMAMSIDGSDVRALYNWGVTLSFRAQLIADIGPGAASDADKLFLAAIDKFDAIMSRSKTYAPDALYRWAMVLQQRSRLRPRNSKDKVRLLQQSKRLYEDAVEMGYDKLQVREALSSSMFEYSPGQSY
ncbi:hypothetical protein V2J09_018877 [Rumex salicifolius]